MTKFLFFFLLPIAASATMIRETGGSMIPLKVHFACAGTDISVAANIEQHIYAIQIPFDETQSTRVYLRVDHSNPQLYVGENYALRLSKTDSSKVIVYDTSTGEKWTCESQK